MSVSEVEGSLSPTPNWNDEEPPSRSRRHPLWQAVPDHQWDDWRWQSQNAIRSVRQLRELLSFSPTEIEAIGSLGPIDVQERHVVSESLQFTLPIELRNGGDR